MQLLHMDPINQRKVMGGGGVAFLTCCSAFSSSLCHSFMGDVKCVDQGNLKDALLAINHVTALAIQAKGHYCSLDTVL